MEKNLLISLKQKFIRASYDCVQKEKQLEALKSRYERLKEQDDADVTNFILLSESGEGGKPSDVASEQLAGGPADHPEIVEDSHQEVLESTADFPYTPLE